MARLLVRHRARDRLLCEADGLIRTASQQVRLTQPRQPEGEPEDDLERLSLPHRLLQKRQTVSDATPQDVSIAQRRGEQARAQGDVSDLASGEGLFQKGNSSLEVALEQEGEPKRVGDDRMAMGGI